MQILLNICALQSAESQREELTSSGMISEGYIGELASNGV